MYGLPALLIFLGFAFVATLFISVLVREWRRAPRPSGNRFKLIASTLFIMLWLSMIASVYIRKAHFHYTLSKLNPSDVYSVQIGKHDFRDQATITDVVEALRRNHWFEVNHGGWGDSIPLTVKRRSGGDLVLDVALYFREPGAIIRVATHPGPRLSSPEAFSPELPRVLEKHGVKLPDCDTPHGRPCTHDQLNP